MAASAPITNRCPRLRHDAPCFTTDEVLSILGDKPERPQRGNLRAIILRSIPKMGVPVFTPALV